MNLDASTQVPKRALEFTSAHIQTHTHTHMHTHAHTRACTHAHTHTHTCTYTRLHTHTHTLTLAHVLHTGPAGNTHTHTCTHTDTHTHPCSRSAHRPSRPWCKVHTHAYTHSPLLTSYTHTQAQQAMVQSAQAAICSAAGIGSQPPTATAAALGASTTGGGTYGQQHT